MSLGSLFQGGIPAPATGGGGGTGAKIATFRPGVASDLSQNLFATWAEVQTWIAANDGFKIIQVDDRFAAATTGGTGVTDADSSILLRGVVDEGNPVQAGFGFARLTINDGDTLNDFTEFENIQIRGLDTTGTADSLTYSFTAITQGIILTRASLRQDGTNPMIVQSSAALIQLSEGSVIDRGSGLVFAAGDELLRFSVFSDSGIDGNVLSNNVGAFVNVEFDVSSSANISDSQPSIAGTFSGEPLMPSGSSSTIAAGVAVVDEAVHNNSVVTINNQAGADDDLDTLDIGATASVGLVIHLRKAGGGTTTVKSGTGNLVLIGDAPLETIEDRVTLQWNGTNFVEISRAIRKEVFFMATDYNANCGNVRVRNLAAAGGHRFTFHAPPDMGTVISAVLIGIPSAGAAGANKNIDLISDYGTIGEASNFHSESDVGTLYDFTGTAGEWTEVLDLLVVLSVLAANDYVGIFVDHNGIGGAIDYVGIRLVYR